VDVTPEGEVPDLSHEGIIDLPDDGTVTDLATGQVMNFADRGDLILPEDVGFDDFEEEDEVVADPTEYLSARHEVVDGVQDLGPDVETRNGGLVIVRVVEDIGPVYYGKNIIEMKRGRRYQVTQDIYDWLLSKKAVLGQ
jgi:hypothetical protein